MRSPLDGFNSRGSTWLMLNKKKNGFKKWWSFWKNLGIKSVQRGDANGQQYKQYIVPPWNRFPDHGSGVLKYPGLGRLYGTALLLRQKPSEFFKKNPRVRTPHVSSNFLLDTSGHPAKCSIKTSWFCPKMRYWSPMIWQFWYREGPMINHQILGGSRSTFRSDALFFEISPGRVVPKKPMVVSILK